MKRTNQAAEFFLDNGIAMLDLGLWIFGFPDVKSVTATNYFHNTKSVEDSSIAMIRFKNNAVLTIEVSWGMLREGELFYCNVYGKEGSSSINPFKIYKRMDGNLYNITPKKLATPPNPIIASFVLVIKFFFEIKMSRHPNHIQKLLTVAFFRTWRSWVILYCSGLDNIF